jgi:hypothetical protein
MILQGNRVGCRQAKRLPYELFEASLCAFFERGGFAAQMRENFAGKMQ